MEGKREREREREILLFIYYRATLQKFHDFQEDSKETLRKRSDSFLGKKMRSPKKLSNVLQQTQEKKRWPHFLFR